MSCNDWKPVSFGWSTISFVGRQFLLQVALPLSLFLCKQYLLFEVEAEDYAADPKKLNCIIFLPGTFAGLTDRFAGC